MEGGLRRGEIFGYALQQPARSVCFSSERFFTIEFGNLLMNMHVMWVYLKSAPRHTLKLNITHKVTVTVRISTTVIM